MEINCVYARKQIQIFIVFANNQIRHCAGEKISLDEMICLLIQKHRQTWPSTVLNSVEAICK